MSHTSPAQERRPPYLIAACLSSAFRSVSLCFMSVFEALEYWNDGCHSTFLYHWLDCQFRVCCQAGKIAEMIGERLLDAANPEIDDKWQYDWPVDDLSFAQLIMCGNHCLSRCRFVANYYGYATTWGYRSGSPTAVQAWQPCPLWELSPSHPILL